VSLRDVDLDVRAGEVLAIAGVAGAGQGELFAALSGERPPSGGRIVLDGADVTRMGIAERRARRAAFVPEERLGQATLPTASLADNLALSLPRAEASKTSGVLDRSGFDRRLGDVVERFDVRMSGKNPEARRLSGGNLQKYVIGREILRRPGLLVVNQPTWGVDAAATQAIRQALLDLARDGAAVLIISQDLDEVFALADRIAVLHGGRLSQATPVALATRESVGLLMTGGEGARDAA
jgi:simple sugar transport system ATP-binding protein